MGAQEVGSGHLADQLSAQADYQGLGGSPPPQPPWQSCPKEACVLTSGTGEDSEAAWDQILGGGRNPAAPLGGRDRRG